MTRRPAEVIGGIGRWPQQRLQSNSPLCGPCVQILTMDETSKIGKISKQWTGLLREAFTDSDNFGIQFPMDLDVKMKAVMIGACFLIVSTETLLMVESLEFNN